MPSGSNMTGTQTLWWNVFGDRKECLYPVTKRWKHAKEFDVYVTIGIKILCAGG